MYTSAILLFLSMPLVLGSFFSFIIFLTYPVIMVKRIRNEEEVLEKSLVGQNSSAQLKNQRVGCYIN
jgi:protein-S-isoprenylcysteine O-methyltransferase Ste14